MFYIIASDLDGTLLSSKNLITDFTKNILKLLIIKGIYFVFATGRHYFNVLKIRNVLGIKAYMITSNGAKIYNVNNELIFSHNLNETVAGELFGVVYKDRNITTNIFRNDEWFVSRFWDNQNDFFDDFTFKSQIYHPDTLSTDGVCKIYFTSDDDQRLLILESYLNKRWSSLINVSFSLPMCLEVMAKGVSKGNALRKVANILGYGLNDCISFGDGMNDREMLSMTGKGCIMGNASQRLKDALPDLEIIGTNDEDAVSHYLYNMYLKSD